jgi:acetyltransferase-like isoleucine patch superfamily enzyme
VISSNVLITNVDHEYYDIHKPILNQPRVEKSTIIVSRCFIGFGVVIQAGTRLGKHCVVGANSVIRGVFPDYCVIAGSPARIIKQYNLKTEKWGKVGQ